MKRIIAYLSVLLILFSFFTPSAVHCVRAAENAQIETGTATVKPGDTEARITLRLSRNPGICGMILRISYDSRLTLKSVDRGSALPSLTMAELAIPYINPLNVSWDGIRGDFENGELLTMVFAIPANAAGGRYDISVSYLPGDVYDSDLNDLSLDITSGYIQVQSEAVHTHSLVRQPAAKANCHKTGNIEYWRCSSCKMCFLDQNAMYPVTDILLQRDVSNHDGLTELRNVRAATYTSEGYTGDLYCLGCRTKILSGTVIPRLEKTSSDTTSVPVGPSVPTAPSPGEGEWMNPFTDISEKDSFYPAIRFVCQKGLFKGVSDSEFAPETTMTRAMFVTVLGRLAEVDVSRYADVQFRDVKPGEWYTPYVGWAEEKGIVQGYGNDLFGVNDQITIEQAGVILARYARFIGQDTSSDIALLHYDDGDKVADWAEESMCWLVQNGIYEGAGHFLSPKAPAARSQVAEFLYRFVQMSED